MAVVFDTSALAPDDRCEAAAAALRLRSFPSHVEWDTTSDVSVLLELWDYGAVTAFRAEMSGHHQFRSASHIRAGQVGRVAIAVQESGIGRLEQRGDSRVLQPGDLFVVDLDEPYAYGWDGNGAARSVRVPVAAAGIVGPDLDELAHLVRTGPLCPLVTQHIWHLCSSADPGVSPRPAVGTATAALIRGMFAGLRTRAGMVERTPADLVDAVTVFVRTHLTDPGLSETMIADNLGVTPADLHELSVSTQFDLERWILAERLVLAREMIREQNDRWRPEQSQRWGFGSTAQFTTEFAATYGVSPDEWQQISAAERAIRDDR